MDEIKISFATVNDIEYIMKFIDEYWKKGHILATNRQMFEWQYRKGDDVHFVMAKNKEGIKGILGYVPYGEGSQKNIALALWKTISSDKPFLGVELLQYLDAEQENAGIVCPGINMRTTAKLYRLVGMHVDKMTQWYRLGRQRNFVIGKIVNNHIPQVENMREYVLTKYDTPEQMLRCFDFESYKNSAPVPYKSQEYLTWRYFNHPVYQYDVYGICRKNDVAEAIIVLRTQTYENSSVIRFVDYIGSLEVLPSVTNLLDDLLEVQKAEYIDIYEAGVSEQLLIRGGWTKVETSGNIIPNYFAPFEQSNVDIYYSTANKNAILFRGDGDQDRPN